MREAVALCAPPLRYARGRGILARTMAEGDTRKGLTRAEVRETLFRLMKENTRVDPADLKDDARLIEDLGLDSLDITSVVNEVEHEFKITIPDDRLPKLSTVSSVVDALWERLEK